MLLVNARYDAFSSLARARTVADSMPGARLLTVEGPGHTLEATDSACADHAVERYLIAGKLPAQGRDLRPGQHAVLRSRSKSTRHIRIRPFRGAAVTRGLADIHYQAITPRAPSGIHGSAVPMHRLVLAGL